MSAIKGKYENGHVILNETADWPEGTQVLVEPLSQEQTFGIREEDWVDTPEAVSAWLRWYDSLEPLEFTPDEQAGLDAWRRRVKEYTMATMDQEIKGMFP